MKQMIRERLVDCSDDDWFRFSITCAECGRVWQSTPIRFSKADSKPFTEAKFIIAQALYAQEHAQALECAVSEAVNHFNVCPLCKSLVCNHCFIMCADLDMCRDCAAFLKEKGEAVMKRPLVSE